MLRPARRRFLPGHSLAGATKARRRDDFPSRRRDTMSRRSSSRIRSDFGPVESWRYTQEDRDGVDGLLEITVSGWIFNAIVATEVLTISRNHFRLRGGPISHAGG